MSPRTYQTEQLVRLQASGQSDLEILEDLRDFTKARAKLEIDYANQLSKLAQQSLGRRRWHDPRNNQTNEHISSQLVYKTILEKADSIAGMHLKAGERLNASVSEEIKAKCQHKKVHLKKCAESHSRFQDRFHQRARDLDHLRKLYSDQERITQYQLEKWDKQKDGLSKGKKSFKTITKSKDEIKERVRKQGQKVEECQQRADKARNDYLLGVVAMNAQHKYYTEKTLPDYLSHVNEDHHAQIKGYMEVYAATHREVAQAEVDFTEDISASAAKIDKEFEESCLLGDSLFQDLFEVHFEPFGKDEVRDIDNGPMHEVENTALMQRYVNNAQKARNTVEKKKKAIASTASMQQFQSANIGDSDAAATQSIEEVVANERAEMIEAEWEVIRNEARIARLESVGVPVPESAAEEHLTATEGDAHSLASWRGSSGVSLNASQAPPGDATGSINSMDADFDDHAVAQPPTAAPPRPSARPVSNAFAPTLLAQYAYDATADDELTITEGEGLCEEFPDDEGWTCVRNSQGLVGLVPTSYLASISNSSSSPEPAATCIPQVTIDAGPVAIAQYDHEGTGDPNELLFEEGDRITVTQFDEDDDGFWMGSCNGRTGVFPSLLVELEE
ncbi:hypothetical protein SARC_04258 [Sphaeroforma arctica JP610]|uniref:Uncharacterized protein n=1 Tax=Sphaeroforma arctica JP610 TaxID=667725 RepID=A0A0L0G2Z4_9EUKA|nr:hypothetical protein SARC_04258 [Sphaeroforma arctica JP610]KNC83502.1 hypothetical protein SARC_04258 [Sphaeroforma arctica JP610]|eukprot:XP_014157404.1 hypothetical protein SARC_04258 [Sphaeroforma arctica JP610]